jgi:hypothetical protein
MVGRPVTTAHAGLENVSFIWVRLYYKTTNVVNFRLSSCLYYQFFWLLMDSGAV